MNTALMLVTGLIAAQTFGGATAAEPPVPVVHASDLFRPHGDPDDHWDLACDYALAHQGRIDLKAVLGDFPPPIRHGDPDVLAVAQMNYLTGLAVPLLVGTPLAMESPRDTQPAATPLQLGGIGRLLEILRQSPRPVAIHVLGSCQSVAVAGRREPGLFAAKCAGIYLNAGTGSPDPAKAARREYNVALDRAAYAAIFDLPCPVYWMPCFEELEPKKPVTVSRFGTYYRFLQGDVLPHLSPRVQNFFAFMYERGRTEKKDASPRDDWLRSLLGPRDEALLARQGALFRNMWCTAGFLHAAGLSVTGEGKIVPLAEAGDRAVFAFDPIRVRCSEQGITEWSPDPAATNRFIFHVRDTTRYQAAMTTALGSLLKILP